MASYDDPTSRRTTALLAGKTPVVTGGASGIGRRIATAFAENDAGAVVADRRDVPSTDDAIPTLAAIEDETDSRASYVECELTVPDDLRAAVDAAAAFGGIDVTVNDAGVSQPVGVPSSSEADYYPVTDVLPKGVLPGCRGAARAMGANGGGSIVDVSSTAADRGSASGGSFLYVAIEGGTRSMTYSLAAVLGPAIRVNALQPGCRTGTGLVGDGHDSGYERTRAGETALERLGTPSDAAGVVLFLASDLARYVTAESVLVDGGWVHTGGP